MNSRNTDEVEPMDNETSRAICDAVGERLERAIHAEHPTGGNLASLSPHLQHLMDELRRRQSER